MIRPWRTIPALLGIALLTGLTGCSSSAETTAAVSSPVAESAAVQAQLDELYAAAKDAGETQINVYSLEGEALSDVSAKGIGLALAAFHKQYPDITLVGTALSGAKLFERVQAEDVSGNHQGDIAISGVSDISTLKAAHQLVPYSPAGAQRLQDIYKDPEGFVYVPWYQFHSINYNTTKIKADQLPRSWEELADPSWKGRFSVAQPLGLEPTSFNLATLYANNAVDEELLRKVFANAVVEKNMSDVIQGTLQGKVAFSINSPGSVFLAAKAKGAPVDTADFEGKHKDTQQVGILADGPHPKAAELFAAWLFTDTAQKSIAENSYFFSVLPEVQPNAAWPALSEYTRTPLSSADANRVIEGYLPQIQALFPAQ